jgi:hypothetical protein
MAQLLGGRLRCAQGRYSCGDSTRASAMALAAAPTKIRARQSGQIPLSRAASAKSRTAAENLWCQVLLLNSVQGSIAISDAEMSMCARFIMSARISGWVCREHGSARPTDRADED